MVEIKSKHVPVHVNRATYANLKNFQDGAGNGRPMTQILDEIITDWLTTIGAAQQAAQKEQTEAKRAKLLNIAAHANHAARPVESPA